jgi:hypothetical protein
VSVEVADVIPTIGRALIAEGFLAGDGVSGLPGGEIRAAVDEFLFLLTRRASFRLGMRRSD